MRTKLFLIAVATVVSLAEFANAGFVLYVDFGETLQDPPTEASQLRTSYGGGTGNTLIANYYLRLTGGSTLYAYRFSVEFSNKLTFVSATQTRPSGLIPQIVSTLNPVPLAAPTDEGGVLKRFSGIDPNVYDFHAPGAIIAGDGFYKLATTTFTITQTINSTDTVLVKPVRFDRDPANPDVLLDGFATDDFDGAFIPDVVGGIVAVPEPSSLLLVGTVGVVCAIRYRRFSRKK